MSDSGAVDRSAAASPNLARQQQTLECDYDKGPTDLYQAIEAKQWDFAVTIFERDSGRQQAATWVTRKEPNGKLRWRLLPLHAAVIFQAPLHVVEGLLAEYPEAASCKDDQGMLPLHLAMRNKPPQFDVLEELLTANPAAVYVKDRKGRDPLQGGKAALKEGDDRAILSVLELYTQISTAGERQRWLAEQQQVADQRLAATQEQHVQRLTALKNEFEKEYRKLEENHARGKAEYKAKLEVAREREGRLRNKIQELSSRLEGSHYEVMQQREFSLKEQNQDLRLLLQRLLDQQSSLALSMEKLSWEQKELHEKRNNLMQECLHVNETLSTGSQNHADTWKAALDVTHGEVTDHLANLYAEDRELGRDEGQKEADDESTPKEPSGGRRQEEKKEDDSSEKVDRVSLARSDDAGFCGVQIGNKDP